MRNIDSAALKAVKYIGGMCTLKVTFQNGMMYNYSPVLKKEYDAFMSAESKGKYLNEHFKGRGKKVSQ